MEAYIKAVAYYLPENVLSNEMISNLHPEWSINKIAEKTGIHNRHISEENEFASDLAMKAAAKLMEEYSLLPSIFDFILLCTQSPDYPLPTTACLLQTQLNIPSTAGALDFNLGCSGYIYGLALAKGLIVSGIAKNILFITAETYSKYIHPGDKSNKTIFGDGAAASHISTDGFAKIEDFVLGTDGTGANNLIVKEGGSRSRGLTNEKLEDSSRNIHPASCLFMNGPEIFTFTAQSVPKLIRDTISKNNLAFDDIDGYIFHQANLYMLNFLKKMIKIPDEKFFVFIEDCGNTVSSTIPIALEEAKRSGFLKNKKNIILAGFGVGYSWGGVLLQLNKEEIN
jgi:3-oxoacyl-[acyl-carrier-protein] synthase-3